MVDTLTFYKGRGIDFKQKWRWRYQAQGNYAKLANGGEGYTSQRMCIESACRVIGVESSMVVNMAGDTRPVTRCDGRVIQPVFND